MKRILALFFLAFLTACGSSDDGLSTKDLAIKKATGKKAVVQYGMSRVDAEKVLGEGEKKGMGDSYEYGDGVSVMYREDKVAGIYLTAGSEEVYETVAGLKVGMSDEEIKNIYGEHYLQSSDRNLDYAYDSSSKQFLKDNEWAKKFEDDTKIYLVSIIFEGEGRARTVMLTDRQMAMTFR